MFGFIWPLCQLSYLIIYCPSKSAAIDKAADEGGLRNARNLPTAQRAHTRQNPIVHTGFEPVSPDPKSSMIDHYTKGLIIDNIVIYIYNLFVRDL